MEQRSFLSKYFSEENRNHYIILFLIFFIGIVMRLYGLGTYPGGFNQDEASAGYDAFSILKYGIDRNNVSFPVHLIAWGSGQNIAYSWICMPFISLFGLNEFSVRLPMALIGSISVIVIYYLIKNIYNEKTALIGAFIFAISPWHIMKSRWALESNLFPDLILIACLLLILFCVKKRPALLYAGFFVLGFSAYAYGISYFFLPVFILPVLIYLFKWQKIKIKNLAIAMSIFVIIALPIMIFAIINTFNLPEFKLGFLTIPKLHASRFGDMASIFSKDFIDASIANFKESFNIIINQNDNLPWNSIAFYGITYVVSLPFTIIGIVKSFVRKTDESTRNISLATIMNFWFIASLLLTFIVVPNINRINVIMIPLIYYTIIGVSEIMQNSRTVCYSIAGLYMVMFLMFTSTYFNSYQKDIKTYFFYSLKDAIQEANNLDSDTVYITDNVNAPYIYALFYSKADPKEYISTVQYNYKNVAFESIRSFSKYKFYIPDVINRNEKAAYIVRNTDINKFPDEYFNIKTFEKYSVAVLKH